VTIIVATHVSRANRAGSLLSGQSASRLQMPVDEEQDIPRGCHAKRSIDVHKASEGTNTATETAGKGRAQKPKETGEGYR
jgi:hypothetical protein